MHLPRFQLSFSKEISPELKQLGVTSAYNGGLNNVGNGSRGELALSFVKHDAVLMVDEEGTKAAAVTTVGSVSRGLSTTPPREIKIDKPFYFAVVNKELKTILFWGKLSNPENWKD